MTCCTPKCKKWTIFSISGVFLVLGIILCTSWNQIFDVILKSQLNIGSRNTLAFKMWKETPIPMYIEFYLFNWTNHKEVVDSNWKIPPHVVEKGPYTFSEKNYREGIIFNDNHTVTFKTNKIWHFEPTMSPGVSLDDEITQLNPMLASMAYLLRSKHVLIDVVVNFILEEKGITLTNTHKASEWLFDGYEDKLLDLVHKLNITLIKVPFKKFGYFVERNNTPDYDGLFQVKDGTQNIRDLGRLTLWNGSPRVTYYPDHCGDVNGTNGELWYPTRNDVKATIFSSDTCSSLDLHWSGYETLDGIQGHRYEATDRLMDNGLKYPDMRCFSPGDVSPSGVRNVSQCKYGAPAFISHPHFYLADSYYRDQVTGMSPNKTKHQLFVNIEPTTGIPLQVQAAMQINFKLTRVPRIKLLENVKELYMPMMWFSQKAKLSGSLADQTKLILVVPAVGTFTGYGLLSLGILMSAIALFITYRKGWKGNDGEILLTQDDTL